MPVRSVLITPVEAFERLLPATAGRPDAVMLDPGPEGSSGRRDGLKGVAAALEAAGRPAVWARLPPLDEAEIPEAVAALRPLGPDAFVLSKAETAADVEHLGALLATEEAEAGLADGALRIVVMIETAGALFEMHRAARASRRLIALGWDGEALARDLGADEDREIDGRWTDPLQTARTLALAACADAGLDAIDSPFTDVDAATFRREAERAARDGFAGKFAVDPEQAAIIAAVFDRER